MGLKVENLSQLPGTGDALSQTQAAQTAFGAIDGAVGLGVDIVEVERMRKILKRSPAFARKVFSAEE